MIPIRQRFLIVCEGEKTEPNYFMSFRVPGIIAEVYGEGMVTMSLVQKTIELRHQDDYDQTWCVFDKDDNSDDEFNRAIDFAARNNISVAYSNQCFELWYVLHFNYLTNSITRNDYMRILDDKLHHKYEKKSRAIYSELRDSQQTAIRNAEKLLLEYNPRRAARDDPSTTVHLLVKQLLKFS